VKNVLLVGATSAIASELARRLAARGDRLYLLGGRSREKLDALTAALGSAVVGAEVADIDELDANPGRVAKAIAALGRIDWAVVATGLLGDQLATERDPREAEQVLRTNLTGIVSVLIPIANHLEQVGGGNLAVLSSVAGERGRPRNYTYGAAKAALNVYLQGVRSRLYRGGTRVHVCKLGPVDTPMTTDHAKNLLFAEPGPVSEALIRVIESGRETAYVPWYWAPIMTAVRNLPEALFQRLSALSGR
jgi:short-subunit dehydrogenase